MLGFINTILATNDAKIVVADSLKTIFLDTAGKTNLEKQLISSINSVSNTPADQLVMSLLDKCIQFGLKLLAAVAIYFIGAWLIRVIKGFIRKFLSRKKAEPAVISFVTSVVTAMLWIIVIIIAIGTLGVETTSLAALLAGGGVAIGMAMSGTMQNFAGGLIILIFKPFKVGDYIEAMNYEGSVLEMNISSTKIVTIDNRVIILPNGPLQNGTVNNYSAMPFRRIDMTIGVEYGNDAELVKALLYGIAASDERILKSTGDAPTASPVANPFVSIASLGPSSVNFILRLWVNTKDYWDVYYMLNERIYEELPRNGVKFPFPQLSVHMEN